MPKWREEVLAEGVRLIQGDCREVLPTLGKVDAVVTDPPYGIGEGNQKRILSRGKLAQPKDYGHTTWDDQPVDRETIALIRACSQHQIIFGGNYFEGLGPTSCWLIWDKQNGDNDFADCELAWTNLQAAAQTICDPFAGSFSTGVACIRRGKRFIGIEREPAYFEIGLRRLSEELAKPRLELAAPVIEQQGALL